MRNLILFTVLASTAMPKTVVLKIYPPDIRFHAGSEGQNVLVVATDDEGNGKFEGGEPVGAETVVENIRED